MNVNVASLCNDLYNVDGKGGRWRELLHKDVIQLVVILTHHHVLQGKVVNGCAVDGVVEFVGDFDKHMRRVLVNRHQHVVAVFIVVECCAVECCGVF